MKTPLHGENMVKDIHNEVKLGKDIKGGAIPKWAEWAFKGKKY